MDPTYLRLAEIGLRAAAQYGFALAGGYAVQVHGLLERPSEDVDLFTAWERRDEFATAVEAVVNLYNQAGYTVEIAQQFDTFARLLVAETTDEGHAHKVELAANWRAQPPVIMDIGPVLHVDDVVAGKMSALFTRGEPRDFLDIDAAITSGRYSRARLLELASEADAGFDHRVLADLFDILTRYPDRRFAAYGAAPHDITAMRERFRQWRQELLAD